MTQMNSKITVLEQKVSETDKKISEIEASKAFESQTFHEISGTQKKIDSGLKKSQEQYDKINDQFNRLKNENKRLNEEITDLQSRSMRDNLLFYNLQEKTTTEERRVENCTLLIHEFCELSLGLDNARNNIRIDRAHRIGKYQHGKSRPIVVKFNYYQDKLSVKEKVKEKNGDISVRVSDQYPKSIQIRRRGLIPVLTKAKEEGKNAYVVYNKLYIDGSLYRENGEES